jgi:hypothetical protein
VRERRGQEASLGKALYWSATVIAGLIAAAVVADYMSNAGEGVPFISVTALTVAGAIWLVGWICRNLSALSS